jgi:hypothetical protein
MSVAFLIFGVVRLFKRRAIADHGVEPFDFDDPDLDFETSKDEVPLGGHHHAAPSIAPPVGAPAPSAQPLAESRPRATGAPTSRDEYEVEDVEIDDELDVLATHLPEYLQDYEDRWDGVDAVAAGSALRSAPTKAVRTNPPDPE